VCALHVLVLGNVLPRSWSGCLRALGRFVSVMATFQCTATPFYEETVVDAITHENLRVESQWGLEYSASGCSGCQAARGACAGASCEPDALYRTPRKKCV
jgi:hypothetical protein